MVAKPCFFCAILTLLYNIAAALLPLARRADSMTDIALTASQRSLLGLDPAATLPATPGTAYVTPPRYPRSPTPQRSPASSTRSTSNSIRHTSPYTGRSPALSPSDSPTPWAGRRGSYGSPSPLGLAQHSSSSLVGNGSTSPGALTRSHSGLHSKWLYERTKRSSGAF